MFKSPTAIIIGRDKRRSDAYQHPKVAGTIDPCRLEEFLRDTTYRRAEHEMANACPPAM